VPPAHPVDALDRDPYRDEQRHHAVDLDLHHDHQQHHAHDNHDDDDDHDDVIDLHHRNLFDWHG
jgi:hypothetical protein